MNIKRIDGLSLKSGPTQSGEVPTPPPVGGEVAPVFGGTIMALVIVALMAIFGFILYKKSNLFLRLLSKLGF